MSDYPPIDRFTVESQPHLYSRSVREIAEVASSESSFRLMLAAAVRATDRRCSPRNAQSLRYRLRLPAAAVRAGGGEQQPFLQNFQLDFKLQKIASVAKIKHTKTKWALAKV